MEEIATELVDEIIQNFEMLDIIRLSHINIFYNKEIKKIFLNKKKKTYKEYLGLNIMSPLELLYINKNHLQLTKIDEYKNLYYKLLSQLKIDLYTLYRIYNHFLKLFKEIHILTNDEKIIKNYYDLVRTLIILNERSYYLFSEEGDYCKKKMIICSLLRIILLINPLNRHSQYQEDIRVLFYDFIEKIIKQISKKTDINFEIFFMKFLKDYLFELDSNCIIISYVEIFEFKKFVKKKLKENNLDIYFKF
jgi:hypothetical protein